MTATTNTPYKSQTHTPAVIRPTESPKDTTDKLYTDKYEHGDKDDKNDKDDKDKDDKDHKKQGPSIDR
jgi:hypothetical protein